MNLEHHLQQIISVQWGKQRKQRKVNRIDCLKNILIIYPVVFLLLQFGNVTFKRARYGKWQVGAMKHSSGIPGLCCHPHAKEKNPLNSRFSLWQPDGVTTLHYLRLVICLELTQTLRNQTSLLAPSYFKISTLNLLGSNKFRTIELYGSLQTLPELFLPRQIHSWLIFW